MWASTRSPLVNGISRIPIYKREREPSSSLSCRTNERAEWDVPALEREEGTYRRLLLNPPPAFYSCFSDSCFASLSRKNVHRRDLQFRVFIRARFSSVLLASIGVANEESNLSQLEYFDVSFSVRLSCVATISNQFRSSSRITEMHSFHLRMFTETFR